MSSRVTLNPPGISHENPIPVASRIGPFLATGVLTGKDPDTGNLPSDLNGQVANVFAQIRNVMEMAGGSTDDILKFTVHLVSYRDRDALNREWETMFPDPQSRPARQVMAAQLDRGALIQADLLAVLQYK